MIGKVEIAAESSFTNEATRTSASPRTVAPTFGRGNAIHEAVGAPRSRGQAIHEMVGDTRPRNEPENSLTSIIRPVSNGNEEDSDDENRGNPQEITSDRDSDYTSGFVVSTGEFFTSKSVAEPDTTQPNFREGDRTGASGPTEEYDSPQFEGVTNVPQWVDSKDRSEDTEDSFAIKCMQPVV